MKNPDAKVPSPTLPVLCLFAALLLSSPTLEAQTGPDAQVVRAVRVGEAPRIDGVLDEDAWRRIDDRVHFFEPSEEPGYGLFDGGQPLMGTVITESGEELVGAISWDNDEAYGWEMLKPSGDMPGGAAASGARPGCPLPAPPRYSLMPSTDPPAGPHP